RKFIERDAVEIHAPHALISAGAAIEFDRSAARRDGLELALEMDNARNIFGVLLEVAPYQIFGLVERRTDISIARRRPFSGIFRSRAYQVVCDRHGFAGAAMAAFEHPALARGVQRLEKRARPIGD